MTFSFYESDETEKNVVNTKEEELAELELSLKGEKKSNHHKISNDDEEAIKEMMKLSTLRRSYFDK